MVGGGQGWSPAKSGTASFGYSQPNPNRGYDKSGAPPRQRKWPFESESGYINWVHKSPSMRYKDDQELLNTTPSTAPATAVANTAERRPNGEPWPAEISGGMKMYEMRTGTGLSEIGV